MEFVYRFTHVFQARPDVVLEILNRRLSRTHTHSTNQPTTEINTFLYVRLYQTIYFVMFYSFISSCNYG